MTGSELIALIRPRIGDEAKITYNDNELLGYLNDAIAQMSSEKIIAKDPQMIVEAQITPGTTAVPSEYVSFAGKHPLYLSGGKFIAFDGSSTVRSARYFAAKARIALNENVPFGIDDIPALSNYVVAAASSRIGADASVEITFAQKQAQVSISAASGS